MLISPHSPALQPSCSTGLCQFPNRCLHSCQPLLSGLVSLLSAHQPCTPPGRTSGHSSGGTLWCPQFLGTQTLTQPRSLPPTAREGRSQHLHLCPQRVHLPRGPGASCRGTAARAWWQALPYPQPAAMPPPAVARSAADHGGPRSMIWKDCLCVIRGMVAGLGKPHIGQSRELLLSYLL